MSMFDGIEGQLEAIAGKFGVSPQMVRAVMATVQGHMANNGGNQTAAVQAAAAQHGISADMIQQILSHGTGGNTLAGEAENLLGGLLKR